MQIQKEKRCKSWRKRNQYESLFSEKQKNMNVGNTEQKKKDIIIIFTQPLRSGRIWHKVNFLKRSLTGLNSEFSFS